MDQLSRACLEWWPEQWACLSAQWRRGQVFVRSQCFFCRRVLGSGATPAEQWRRLSNRFGADVIGLVYDCDALQWQVSERWLARAPAGMTQRWGETLVAVRSARHDALMRLGRTLLHP